jgi:uncharacterized protein (TIGR02646 family)
VRYVDIDSVRAQPGVEALIEAARRAQAKVDETGQGDRAKVIKDCRTYWVAFRPAFEQVLGRKCWYTESHNPGSDDDIDHYRPKGGVAECPQHEGYWWEALNWKNFRLSCHRANRLRGNPETGETYGKGEHFPLLVEADRWMRRADENREAPSLLDPTDPADPPLLSYQTDGRAAIAPDYEDDALALERLEQSRIYLHLDWPPFVEDRLALYAKIVTRVEQGNALADAALGQREPQATARLKALARELVELAQPNTAYSRAAVAYVSVHRDKTWIKRMVLPNLAGAPTS